jgi:aminoglycoside phosphotransferase (APT) family kinase protein
MITKPSIAELLEGVERTLEHVVLPELGGSSVPDRLTGVLMVLDRVAAEWDGVARHLAEDNHDIEQTLNQVARLTSGAPAPGLSSESLLAMVPPVAPGRDHPTGDEHLSALDLAERNRRLKAALVWTMEALDLPPSPGARRDVLEADGLVRQLLSRMLHRELEASPPVPPRVSPTSGGGGGAEPPERIAGRLHEFLCAQLPEAEDIRIDKLEKMAGGASREAWLFEVSWREPGGERSEKCVMLRHPVSSVLESDDSEAKITGSRRLPQTEFKIVQLMERHGIPVPHMLWIDAEGKWLDRPFTVSRWLPGDADITPVLGTDTVDRILDQYFEILGRLHNLDPAAVGVDFLGQPTRETAAREQIELFEAGYDKQRLEDFPGIAYMIRWLKKNQPVAERVSIVHGDFRLGNFMYEDDRIIAMLDWEQCHLGDPLEEIAFMYWALWSLEGLVPLTEFVQRYERSSGIPVDRQTLAFYRVFIELKMCVVILTGTKSYFATPERQLQYGASAGQHMLRDCQARFIDELAAGGPTFEFRGAGV